MKSNILLLLLFTLLFSSCSLKSLADLATSEVSQENRNKVLSLVSKVKFKHPKSLSKSLKNIKKLRKGQWVTTLTEDKGKSKDLTLATTKVISTSGNRVVLEIETYKASNNAKRELTQITFRNYPKVGKVVYSKSEVKNMMNNLEIVKISTKSASGAINEVPTPALQMMKGTMSSAFIDSKLNSGKLSRKSCKSEFVKSSRCYKYNVLVSLMGISVDSLVVAHGQIPITGVISNDNEYNKSEVISFGYSGAKSAF